MKSLLIIGEYNNNEVNQNIKRLQKYSMEFGLSTNLMSYEEILKNKSKKIL